LLRNGEPVELGSRAFDLLVVLLKSRGAVVSKNEIVDYVWPSTMVDESNLRFQMACLRRVLGVDRDVIKTIQGRGYLFAAEAASGSAHRPPPRTGEAPRSPQTVLADQVPLRLAGPQETSERTAPSKVAVIDDDRDVREALEALLRSTGLRVETYASVQGFVDSESSGSVGCLVLDVCMPGHSGLDFQADMIKAGLKVPIIFISGHADVHMSVRAMKAGAVEFLTKPVRHEELLSAINAVMAA
jgi:DNA-binding response OmpR family regulator